MEDETATDDFVSHFKDLIKNLDLHKGKIVYHDGMVGIGINVRDSLSKISKDDGDHIDECVVEMNEKIKDLGASARQVSGNYNDMPTRLECVIRAGHIRDLADTIIERAGAVPTEEYVPSTGTP